MLLSFQETHRAVAKNIPGLELFGVIPGEERIDRVQPFQPVKRLGFHVVEAIPV
jgi:hypothetical protein